MVREKSIWLTFLKLAAAVNLIARIILSFYFTSIISDWLFLENNEPVVVLVFCLIVTCIVSAVIYVFLGIAEDINNASHNTAETTYAIKEMLKLLESIRKENASDDMLNKTSDTASEKSPLSTMPPPSTWRCSQCNQKNDTSRGSCFRCGSSLEESNNMTDGSAQV